LSKSVHKTLTLISWRLTNPNAWLYNIAKNIFRVCISCDILCEKCGWLVCLRLPNVPLFTYFSVYRLPISLSTMDLSFLASRWKCLVYKPSLSTREARQREASELYVSKGAWPDSLMFDKLFQVSLCLFWKSAKQPRGLVYFRYVPS